MAAATGVIRAASRRFLIGSAILWGLFALMAAAMLVSLVVTQPFDLVTAAMAAILSAGLAVFLVYLGTFIAAAVRTGCIEIALTDEVLAVRGCGTQTTVTAADVLAYRHLNGKVVMRLAAPVAPAHCAPYIRAAGSRLSIRTMLLADRPAFAAMLRAFDPHLDKKSKFDLGVLLDSLGG